MPMPVGYSTGMPNSSPRSSGITAPTARPYGQPHTMPHSSTGMCIGSSILPICGICPVISGSTRPRAKNRAERVSLRVDVFMIQTPHILFFYLIPQFDSSRTP